MKDSMIDFIRAATLSSVVALLPANASAVPVTFTVGGDSTPASIQATVDSFRATVGNPNNGNTAGPLAGGRREINWDGGGAATTVSGTPFNGFQNIRGALFTTPGTGFTQAPPSGLATQFSNANYSTAFGVFSQQRLFTANGSTITDTTFFIPGTNGATPATVSAFGAVFSDVDLNNITKIDFFDPNGNLLTSVFVPAGSTTTASLSFAGVAFNAGEQIGRVRITSGNTALGANANDSAANNIDVVVMDDFIYSEPIALNGAAVPEPSVAAMLLMGVLTLAGAFSRKRK